MFLNFKMSELIHSDTALKHNIDNIPDDVIILDNLLDLIANVLQPLRDVLGKPILINSGYRNNIVNRLVGGSKSSQHCLGKAVDIKVSGMTPRQLFNFIQNLGIEYDQLILESSWVHISYNKGKNRKQYLEIL